MEISVINPPDVLDDYNRLAEKTTRDVGNQAGHAYKNVVDENDVAPALTSAMIARRASGVWDREWNSQFAFRIVSRLEGSQ